MLEVVTRQALHQAKAITAVKAEVPHHMGPVAVVAHLL